MKDAMFFVLGMVAGEILLIVILGIMHSLGDDCDGDTKAKNTEKT